MIQKIKDLIDVKSIVTLVLTGVFSFMTIAKVLSGEQFMTVFVMVMTYFFAKRPSGGEE
ncbi:hypothetical protein MASR2M70_10900 [Bacillota bacterium]